MIKIVDGKSREVGSMLTCTKHGPTVRVDYDAHAQCPLCQAYGTIHSVQQYCQSMIKPGPLTGNDALVRMICDGVLEFTIIDPPMISSDFEGAFRASEQEVERLRKQLRREIDHRNELEQEIDLIETYGPKRARKKATSRIVEQQYALDKLTKIWHK